MSTDPERFSQLRGLQTAACVVGILGAFLWIALGVLGYGDRADVWMIAAGGAVLFLVLMFMTFAPLLLKIESNLARNLNEVRDLVEVMHRQAAKLDAIVDNTGISDAAKSLARRDEEVETLRTAIRSAIRSERWETASNFIDEIERRFGYREEAEHLREELDDGRNDRIQARLGEAITMIESHFRTHEWERAEAEIGRLEHALPDNARVQGLHDKVKLLKEEHKQQLKRAWEDAVRRNDTDQAIDILKELDRYLTSTEAQTLQDMARNVFKEKLLQLGIQFRFAVSEKRWQDSLAVGLEIVRDFPNSRMAVEVREVLDMLRERARQAAEAHAVS